MINFIKFLSFFLTYATQFSLSNNSNGLGRPNIILIVADDLGWNDVGFHGSSQIPTPNIDTMAYAGIILNNYYVSPICTPSRSALMTGKYPIHTGMQHGVLDGADPRGLPLTEKLLPEYLKNKGYINHIVGKWHLGSYKKKYTPTFRGFDSHLGFWIGHQDYFDHTSESHGSWGLDMRRNMDLAKDLHGKYSTDVFSKEAVDIISNHDQVNPLFLYVAHAAVHSGNSYNPLPVPDSYVSNFSYIKHYPRQRFAGMLRKLDESFGDIIHALLKRKMLENSIVIFTTDNGGPAAGFNENAASNYPLRGVKDTLWEGGIRGTAFVWSALLKNSKRVSNQMMHISDWLPTILDVISVNEKNISKLRDDTKIDGVSLWKSLSENKESPRVEILHNIDDIIGISSLTYKSWKYIKGESYSGKWSNWYGPSGRNYRYNYTLLENSRVFKSLETLNGNADKETMEKMRKAATVNCSQRKFKKCKPKDEPCLFKIDSDPCEKVNVAEWYPDLMKVLEKKLQNYNQTALPPGNLPRDPRGYPEHWDYAWVNFGDLI